MEPGLWQDREQQLSEFGGAAGANGVDKEVGHAAMCLSNDESDVSDVSDLPLLSRFAGPLASSPEVHAALGRRRVAELCGARLASEDAPSTVQPQAGRTVLLGRGTCTQCGTLFIKCS